MKIQTAMGRGKVLIRAQVDGENQVLVELASGRQEWFLFDECYIG